MDQEWTVEQWNKWWQNPGCRPDGDEIENEEGEDDCDYTPSVSEMLIKHKNLLFAEGQSHRVFLTFCGKALESKFLAEQGQDVVGNDCSPVALQGFFTDENIDYESSEKGNFKIYKAKTQKIALYAGDFFDFTPETAGKFDAVWDSASFQSVGVNDRQRYISTVVSIMKPTAKYLLSVTDFKDLRTWKGPPYQITDEIVEETFGQFMTWKVIDHNKWGPYIERIIFLELK